MKIVYLISGKARSGKNQFASYLADVYKTNGIDTQEFSFAKKLKENCKEDFSNVTNVVNNMIDNVLGYLKKEKVVNTPSIHASTAIEYLKENKIKEDDWFSSDKKPIIREFFKSYGTEVFRNRVEENYWVNQTIQQINESDCDVAFITDVRFENEIDMLLKEKFISISIRIERADKIEIHNHLSETSLDDYNNWNYIVDNNDTLEVLKESAETVYEDVTFHVNDVTK